MQRSLISIAVLAMIALHAPASSAAPAASRQQSHTTAEAQYTTQLPRNASPTHYALSLTPDAAGATFKASVTISLDVKQRTRTLTLNAADLAFSAAGVSAGPGQPVQAASKIEVQAEQQTVTLHFATALQPGGHQLQLHYSGVIGTQAAGLFSLDYDSAAGRKRALYTQFENSEARRVLPCWDEPAYKASFALEATIPAGQMAVSNMPVAATSTLADGRQLVRFATTPKMSTYLLFFGQGEFDRASAMEGDTEVGVVTQKGSLAHAQFALDSSRAVLREFNDYFGLKYPLPKLDNVAAPGRSQFFSAMENWGAIFTFENAMLLDPAVSTQADQQEAFLTATHEIAHQWFGDLVTMGWWDDLWLNEGFASWMESRTTARLHPEWNSALDAVDGRELAMSQDALATTHPVVQHIATVEQASQAFDGITYQKGEAVIRMLENYVGSDAWRDGVRTYIGKHAYGNTRSDDLWRDIERSAGKPVTAIAHDFTLQPGVPLIRVADARCKDGGSTVALTQGEFSKDHPDKKPLSWRVPVVAQPVGGAVVRTLVSGKQATLALPGCGAAVLVNAGQSGYYRTLYAPKAFAALAGRFDQLATIDQLGLMSDSWALGLAGMQPASGFLDLAAKVPAGAAPQVWGKVIGVFEQIHQLYGENAAQRDAFDRYARARLAPVLANMGWNAAAGEAAPVANLRAQLIGALSLFDDAGVIAEARRRYAAAGSDASAAPAPLRSVILGVVAAHANAEEWERLRAQAQAEKSAMIKSQLYEQLAASADAALAQRALDLALSEEPGETNSAAMISRVAHRHPDLAFDFALAHRAQVETKVDATSRSRYFPGLGAGSAQPAMIDKLQAYARAHLAPAARGDAKAAAAAVRDRIATRAKRLPEIAAWLARQA